MGVFVLVGVGKGCTVTLGKAAKLCADGWVGVSAKRITIPIQAHTVTTARTRAPKINHCVFVMLQPPCYKIPGQRQARLYSIPIKAKGKSWARGIFHLPVQFVRTVPSFAFPPRFLATGYPLSLFRFPLSPVSLLTRLLRLIQFLKISPLTFALTCAIITYENEYSNK